MDNQNEGKLESNSEQAKSFWNRKILSNSAAVILIVLIIIAGAFAFFFRNDLVKIKYFVESLKTETKVISLITTEREKPSDPGYQLTSSNIKIGDENNYIYLRFNNVVNGNESLENFKKYLELENTVVNLSLPEKAIEGADSIPTIDESDSVIRSNMKIDLTSYENGKLTGILKTKVSEASYWVTDNIDPRCKVDDMMGICVKNIPLNMDLTINFEVQVK